MLLIYFFLKVVPIYSIYHDTLGIQHPTTKKN